MYYFRAQSLVRGGKRYLNIWTRRWGEKHHWNYLKTADPLYALYLCFRKDIICKKVNGEETNAMLHICPANRSRANGTSHTILPSVIIEERSSLQARATASRNSIHLIIAIQLQQSKWIILLIISLAPWILGVHPTGVDGARYAQSSNRIDMIGIYVHDLGDSSPC